MPKYNPNSIWGERNRKESLTGPSKPVQPIKPVQVNQPATKPSQPVRSSVKPSTDHFEGDFDPPKKRITLWVVLGGVAIILFIVLYVFFLLSSVGPKVGIEFPNPGQVLVGDQFTFSVSLSNYSQSVLKNAVLSVYLPDNVASLDSPDQRVIEKAVGDLGPGGINPQDFKLIVTGDPNSTKHIKATLTYGTSASTKTQYETDGGVDILVGGPAIDLSLTPPPSIFSGQNFQTAVNYHNKTTHSFQNAVLTMQYPPVFTFTKGSVPPDDAGNHSWNLGTIDAKGSGTLTITGNIVGPNNAVYTLVGNLAGTVLGNTYPLNSQTASLAIGSSPLSLAMTLNGGSDYIAQADDTLTYTLAYTNTSNITFQNATLKATLLGAMFDLSSLQSRGSFSSITNTVTWSAANSPDLLNLAPGQSGSVTLVIKTKSSFPIRLLSDKNYTLRVSAQIASPTVLPGIAASSTVSAVDIENKMGGAIDFAAKGYWRDAKSGILNAGPYPPKVNQATQYTVHWIITNYSTDAQNVTVSASLQSGTTCTGQIKSNISTMPSCNSANGQITWTIPSIPATTGITGSPAEAILQVANTPAVNQIGQSVTLVGPVTLTATDAFTGSALQASDHAVTTDIPDDKTIGANDPRHVMQ